MEEHLHVHLGSATPPLASCSPASFNVSPTSFSSILFHKQVIKQAQRGDVKGPINTAYEEAKAGLELRSGNAGSLAAASSLAAPSSGTAGIGLDRSGIAGGFTTPSSGAAGSGPVRRGLITSGLITAASSRGAASSAAASPPEQWRWWERLCQEQPHQERPVVQ
ncbi:uncharacterized protein LOC123946621 isoform X3 [Meles meles]|uniref:uncharacterized protein LOC123946621 isoform X3 n=1 Tax=Meles meles TaxID=9662 RepID=UPI001E69BE88|nr:uncharacterized protein LOC123946621 isoform X3 [Meles meles]XP_045868158.1 uncharacterized protein LOC123946621 isoform X3 [Meles meles]